jgi:hypothetical protein
MKGLMPPAGCLLGSEHVADPFPVKSDRMAGPRGLQMVTTICLIDGTVRATVVYAFIKDDRPPVKMHVWD